MNARRNPPQRHPCTVGLVGNYCGIPCTSPQSLSSRLQYAFFVRLGGRHGIFAKSWQHRTSRLWLLGMYVLYFPKPITPSYLLYIRDTSPRPVGNESRHPSYRISRLCRTQLKGADGMRCSVAVNKMHEGSR